MSRRNGDEYSPDPEHEEAQFSPMIGEHKKPWYGDADKVASIITTSLMIAGTALIILLIILACIGLIKWVL